MEALATTIRHEKETRGFQTEVKLPLFANDKTLYIENSKDSTEKLLELINKFSKVTGYKINIQELIAFPYPNHRLLEREIKKTIRLTIASQRINSTKEVKDLYSENYKTMMK